MPNFDFCLICGCKRRYLVGYTRAKGWLCGQGCLDRYEALEKQGNQTAITEWIPKGVFYEG